MVIPNTDNISYDIYNYYRFIFCIMPAEHIRRSGARRRSAVLSIYLRIRYHVYILFLSFIFTFCEKTVTEQRQPAAIRDAFSVKRKYIQINKISNIQYKKNYLYAKNKKVDYHQFPYVIAIFFLCIEYFNQNL